MAVVEDEIERLTRRVRDDPRGTAFVALADALRHSARHAEALRVLREGFRAHPDHAAGRVLLARIHLDQGRRGVALAILEDVFKSDSGNVAAGTTTARLLLEEGRLAEARQVVERLRRAGGADGAVAEVGELLAAGEARGAVRGRDIFDQPALADRMARRGQSARALAVFQRILEGNPDNLGIRARVEELMELETEQHPPPAPSDEGPAPHTAGPLMGYVKHFWSLP